MAQRTRLGLYGGSRRVRAGSFAGKPAQSGKPYSKTFSRLGLYGGPRRARAGSFAGKPPQVAALVPKFEGFRRNIGRLMR